MKLLQISGISWWILLIINAYKCMKGHSFLHIANNGLLKNCARLYVIYAIKSEIVMRIWKQSIPRQWLWKYKEIALKIVLNESTPSYFLWSP